MRINKKSLFHIRDWNKCRKYFKITREQNLTVLSIAMILKLDPAPIYLTSEPEGEIVFADEKGHGTNYHVHGDAKQA